MRQRPLVAALLASLAVVVSTPARAQSTEACANAYEQAQRLRKDGALKAALTQSILCASASCPAPLRRECTEWIAPIRNATPSLSVRVLGRDGCDVVDAELSLDGAPVAGRVDGHAIDLDPGVHVLRVAASGYEPSEQRVVLAQGEKDRPLTVRLGSADAVCGEASRGLVGPPPPPRDEAPLVRPTPRVTYILGGVGIVAAAFATGFAISGFSQKSTLDGCSPTCAHDDADRMRTTFVLADVAGVVSLLSLAAAGLVYFTRPATSTTTRSAIRLSL